MSGGNAVPVPLTVNCSVPPSMHSVVTSSTGAPNPGQPCSVHSTGTYSLLPGCIANVPALAAQSLATEP